MTLDQLVAQMQHNYKTQNYEDAVEANQLIAMIKQSDREDLQILVGNAEYKATIAAKYGEENLFFDEALNIWQPLPYEQHDYSKYPGFKLEEYAEKLNEAKKTTELSLQLDLSEYEKVQKENDQKTEQLKLALDGLSPEFKSKYGKDFAADIGDMEYAQAEIAITNAVQNYEEQIDGLDDLLNELSKQQKYFYSEFGKMAGKDADLVEFEFQNMINNYKESSDKYILQDGKYTRIEGWDVIDTEGLKSAYQEYLIKNPQLQRNENRLKLIEREMGESEKHLKRMLARTQQDNFDLNTLSKDPVLQSEVISVLALEDPEDIFFALSQDTQGAITNIIKSINPVWYAAAEKHYKAGMEIKNERFLDPALKQKHFDLFEEEIKKIEVTDDNLSQAFAIFQSQIAEATEQGDFDKYLKIIEDHWGVDDLGQQFMDMMMPKKDNLENLITEMTGVDLGIATLFPIAYNNFAIQEGSGFKFDVNKAWDFLYAYDITDKGAGASPNAKWEFQRYSKDLPDKVGLVSPNKKSPDLYSGTEGLNRNYKWPRPDYNLATALTSNNSITDRTTILGTPLANNHYYEAFYNAFRKEVSKIHPTIPGGIDDQWDEYYGLGFNNISIFEQEQFYGDAFLYEYISRLPEFEKHMDEIMIKAQAAGEYAQKAWMERVLNNPDHEDHQTVLRALESAYNAYNNEDDPRYQDYLDYFEENSGHLKEDLYPEEYGKTIRHKK
tara:strand:+ start:4758 stop:6926 length:2169 start_codon:yes stop_codon:yes gene_type:complete